MSSMKDRLHLLSNEEILEDYKYNFKFISELEDMVVNKRCDYKFFENYIKQNTILNQLIKDIPFMYVEIVKKYIDGTADSIESAEAAVRCSDTDNKQKLANVLHEIKAVQESVKQSISDELSRKIIIDITNSINSIDNCLFAEMYPEFNKDALVGAGVEYGDVVQCIPLIVKWKISEQDDILFKIRTEINSVLETYQKTDNKMDVGLIGEGAPSHPWYVTVYQLEFIDDEEFGNILSMEVTLQIDWSSF